MCSEVVVGKGLIGMYQHLVCMQLVMSHPTGRGHGREKLDLHPFPEAPHPHPHPLSPPTTLFQVLPQVLPQVQPELPEECGESPRHATLPGGSGRGVPLQIQIGPFLRASGGRLWPCHPRKAPGQISAQPCASGPHACWGWGSSFSTYAGCQGRLH